MINSGWRLYNWYLITGAALFWIWAIFGERPPEPEYWEEFAHYDPAMVIGGEVRGTVRYTNSADCTAQARQKFNSEWVDIVGSTPLPSNGIDAPFVWGCQRVDLNGRRLQEIRQMIGLCAAALASLLSFMGHHADPEVYG